MSLHECTLLNKLLTNYLEKTCHEGNQYPSYALDKSATVNETGVVSCYIWKWRWIIHKTENVERSSQNVVMQKSI